LLSAAFTHKDIGFSIVKKTAPKYAVLIRLDKNKLEFKVAQRVGLTQVFAKQHKIHASENLNSGSGAPNSEALPLSQVIKIASDSCTLMVIPR